MTKMFCQSNLSFREFHILWKIFEIGFPYSRLVYTLFNSKWWKNHEMTYILFPPETITPFRLAGQSRRETREKIGEKTGTGAYSDCVLLRARSIT